MGLLENLAALAIRGQVIAALRAECPEALREPLEMLLGDADAITAVQNRVMQAMKEKSSLSAEDVLALPFSAIVAQTLGEHPELAAFLAATANAKMPR